MTKVVELAFKCVGWADENEGCKRCVATIPTVGFQSIRFVSEAERGFHRRIQISGFSGKSGKMEPLSHLAPD